MRSLRIMTCLSLGILAAGMACKKKPPLAPADPQPTPVPALTKTITPTRTISATLTESATVTETPTISATLTDSATRTPTRTVTPTPTPNPIGATIACSGNNFSPNAATINAGQKVVWTASCEPSHTLYINDGAGGSGCPFNTSNFPVTVTFGIAGTFRFHCSNHSGCGTGSCSPCTGMAGTITVN